MSAFCNCRGEILPHTPDPGSGCPPDWEAIRLLPPRNMVTDGPWCDHREPKPLGWYCAACGAFSRDIPLSAGWDRVVEDYEDHRDNRCPGRRLVCVETVDRDAGTAVVEIPAWPPGRRVVVRLDGIPGNVRDRFAPGSRHHARVNIGAAAGELVFADWEEK